MLTYQSLLISNKTKHRSVSIVRILFRTNNPALTLTDYIRKLDYANLIITINK